MRRVLLATMLFLLFLAVVFPGRASAAVAFGASGNGTFSATSGSISLNLSSLPTSNTMLLVGIAIGSSSSSVTVSSVTWGGTALSLISGCSATGSVSNSAHMEIWSLANPSNISSTVAITISSSQTVYAGAAGFTGVSGLGTCVIGSGGTGSTSNSLSPSVPTGGAAFDTMAVNTISSATITVGSGQTTVYNHSSSGSAGAESYELAPVSSVSDSWNTGTSVWAHGAVPLNPSATSGRKGQVIIGTGPQGWRWGPQLPALLTVIYSPLRREEGATVARLDSIGGTDASGTALLRRDRMGY
jgi:hypothetical protein